jgi:hypothetical protein
MKIRSGFVSNSSSSSFIIAVPNTAKECKCCHRSDKWMLQAVGKYLTTLSDKANKLYPMTNAEQVEEYFKNELSAHIKTKGYAEEQLKEIKDLEKSPKVFEDYTRLKKQLDTTRYGLSINAEAEGAQYESPKDTLTERRKRIERHIEDYDKKLKEIKDIISKVRKATKTDCTVYAFTIDRNWNTDAETALKKMIDDKIVESLWELHT